MHTTRRESTAPLTSCVCVPPPCARGYVSNVNGDCLQVGSAAPPLLAVIINAIDNGQALRWVMLGGVTFSYTAAAACFVMSARCVAQRESQRGGGGIAAVEGAVTVATDADVDNDTDARADPGTA